MKMSKKNVFLFLVAAIALTTAGCNKSSGGGGSGNKTITIDPGSWYISTRSMEKSDANPHPFNELQMMADEYAKDHPGVTIKVVEVAQSDNREVLIPQLRSRRAPDIVYQNMGVYKNMDLDQDWFVKLNRYFDEPNPYVPGNEKWSDQFVQPWFKIMRSTDGEHRYIPIDTVPIGIIYNKELFAKAGIVEAPVTFKEFMDAQDKLHAIGVIPYLPIYHWWDIALEGSILSDIVVQGDVLNMDGVLDTEEIARLFEKGILSGKGPEYAEYCRITKEKTKYYPAGWQQTDVLAAFVQGQVAMIEAVGIHMRTIEEDSTRRFEVGTIPFPLLTAETTPFSKKGIVRGNAGYNATWNITNTAVDNGTVDICIDFCRWLTIPENNSRLVNAAGQCVPGVLGSEPLDLFKGLNAYVEIDMNNGFLDWHGLSIHDAFDGEFNSIVDADLYPAYTLGEITAEQYMDRLDEEVNAAIRRLERSSNWDKSRW
jgi:ABC-type glycerol-3-phosphate transport system substrate-binding protein